MVPVIASSGTSFNGAFAYYFHDKNASTTARIAWTQTINMMTQCVEKAKKVMAYTVKAQEQLKLATGQTLAGNKLKKPVFCYSLSWNPEEQPDKEEMLRAAHLSLEKLGLSEHEVAIAAHKDEPHPHIHLIVNTVHPLTGMVASLKYTKRKLSDFAREYEKQRGKIYCKQREVNHQKRQNGKPSRHNDPVIASAWQNSTDAKGFHSLLLKQGYDLARGRKRLVVVDKYNKSHNPVRHLKDIAKAKEFHQRMEDIDQTNLPTVETLIATRKAKETFKKERLEEDKERYESALSITQSRHIRERETLSSHHDLRVNRKRLELEKIYQFERTQKEITTLKSQLENPKLLQKIAFKLFKTDRTLIAIKDRLEASQQRAQKHMSETINTLKKERDNAIATLEKRQKSELKKLKHRFEPRKPTLPSISRDWQQASRSHQQQRPNPEHHRSTPTLSR